MVEIPLYILRDNAVEFEFHDIIAQVRIGVKTPDMSQTEELPVSHPQVFNRLH